MMRLYLSYKPLRNVKLVQKYVVFSSLHSSSSVKKQWPFLSLRTNFKFNNNVTTSGYQPFKFCRFFATSTKKVAGEKKKSLPARVLTYFNRPIIRYTWRAGRTVFVLMGVWATAYAYGQIELLDDPEGHQSNIFYSTVCQDNQSKYFLSFYDSDNLPKLAHNLRCPAFCYEIDNQNKRYKRMMIANTEQIWTDSLRVQKVFIRVKHGALSMFEDRVKEIKRKIEQEMKNSSNADNILALYEELHAAKIKRNSLRKPWNLIMLLNPSPNAFVNGFLPQKIFIHSSAMRHFANSDDELALLLGHELSHYLQGHTKDTLLESSIMKIIAMVALSLIDPTGGIGGFAIELFLPWIDSMLLAANSREHESEADRVGLEIVARSCYDPAKAVNLFTNMKAFEEKYQSRTQLVANEYNMLNTHPLSAEREKEASNLVDKFSKKYSGQCSFIKSRFRSLFS